MKVLEQILPNLSAPAALTSRATAAFGWNLAGFAVKSLASFGINLLLARLLGPGPFGLVAMAMVVIALGNLLVDSGFGVQLIQKREIHPAEIRSVFTLQLALGASLTLALFLTAPIASAMLSQPALANVVRALSFSLFINGCGQTSTALLRRNLNFKAIQKSQIASYVLGYGFAGIPMAIAGFGVWTLVTAQLTQSAVYVVLTWLCTRHSLALRTGPEMKALVRFGTPVAATNIVSWAIGSLPSVFIAKRYGVFSLGLYNRAFMMVGVPLTIVASSLQTVSLSLYSRLADDKAAVTRVYLGIVALVSLIAFPCFLFAGATAKASIEVLLGEKWLAASALLLPLALAMPLDAIAAVTSSMLISRGRPEVDLWSQVITLSCGTLAFVVSGLMQSATLTVLAWQVCVSLYAVRAIASVLFVKREVPFSWAEFFGAVFGGALLGGVTFAISALVESQLSAGHVHPAIRLSAALLASVAGVVVVLRSSPGILCRELTWLSKDVSLPISPAIRRSLLWLRPSET